MRKFIFLLLLASPLTVCSAEEGFTCKQLAHGLANYQAMESGKKLTPSDQLDTLQSMAYVRGYIDGLGVAENPKFCLPPRGMAYEAIILKVAQGIPPAEDYIKTAHEDCTPLFLIGLVSAKVFACPARR